MSSIRKFENLPNEILLECCQYLNAPHLFHSFDDLNRRFSDLIRSTKLHLSFSRVNQSIYEEFHTKILNEPTIKEQVISIDLCDERTLIESDRFLSDYDMKEFSQVKYLSLRELVREYAKEFLPLLSSMSQVRYFNLDVNRKGWVYLSYEDLFRPLENIFIEQLQRLKIFMLPKTIENPRKTFWLLEHLTVERITFEQIRPIFRYCPRLKQLETEWFVAENSYIVNHPVAQRSCALNLKKLSIQTCVDFESLEYLFILTPNLQELTFIMEESATIIDGQQWQRLINSYLPNLIHFQLHLFYRWYVDNDIEELKLRLKGFHGDFWKIRYEMTSSTILVYSIPYPSNKYRLSSLVDSYQSTTINFKMIFEQVKDLSIDYSMIENLGSYSFPNVECLRLTSEYKRNSEQKQHLLTFENIEKLNKYLTLSKLEKLFIDSEYEFQSPSVLIQLLNTTNNLSKLGLDLHLFRDFSSNNEQFSSLLGNKLKYICTVRDTDSKNDGSTLFDDLYSVEKFCEQYPQLEQLGTDISRPSDFLTLLRRLPKLTLIEALMPLVDYGYDEEIADEWGCELIPALIDELHIRDDEILFLYQSIYVIVRIIRHID